jgi:hypothetical protein
MTYHLDEFVKNYVLTSVNGIMDDNFHAVLASKLLEKFTEDHDFAEDSTIAWAIMNASRQACKDFAYRIAFNPSMDLAHRLEAMMVLIDLCALDLDQKESILTIKSLLLYSLERRADSYHKANFIESAILNDAIWRKCKNEIRLAIADVRYMEKLSPKNDLLTKFACLKAIRDTPTIHRYRATRQHQKSSGGQYLSDTIKER